MSKACPSNLTLDPYEFLGGCSWLVRDDERLPETSETLIYLAMIRIMVRRLA